MKQPSKTIPSPTMWSEWTRYPASLARLKPHRANDGSISLSVTAVVVVVVVEMKPGRCPRLSQLSLSLSTGSWKDWGEHGAICIRAPRHGDEASQAFCLPCCHQCNGWLPGRPHAIQVGDGHDSGELPRLLSASAARCALYLAR